MMEQIFHVTASNDEVCLLVCYATSRKKAINLTKEWIAEMGGPEEVNGIYEFTLFQIDLDRIGFDECAIISDPIELTYSELGITE